jgi:hypothetical protein
MFVSSPYLSIKPVKVFFHNLVIYPSSVVIPLEYTKSRKAFKLLSTEAIRPFCFANKLERESISASSIAGKVNSNSGFIFSPTTLLKVNRDLLAFGF